MSHQSNQWSATLPREYSFNKPRVLIQTGDYVPDPIRVSEEFDDPLHRLNKQPNYDGVRVNIGQVSAIDPDQIRSTLAGIFPLSPLPLTEPMSAGPAPSSKRRYSPMAIENILCSDGSEAEIDCMDSRRKAASLGSRSLSVSSLHRIPLTHIPPASPSPLPLLTLPLPRTKSTGPPTSTASTSCSPVLSTSSVARNDVTVPFDSRPFENTSQDSVSRSTTPVDWELPKRKRNEKSRRPLLTDAVLQKLLPLWQQLQLTDGQIAAIKQLWERARQYPSIQQCKPNQGQLALLGAITYTYCISHGILVTYGQIQLFLKAKRRVVEMYIGNLRKAGLAVPSTPTRASQDWVRVWCQRMQLPSYVSQASVKVCQLMEQHDVLYRNNPLTRAAVAVHLVNVAIQEELIDPINLGWIAKLDKGPSLHLADLHRTSGCSPATIQNVYKSLNNTHLGVLSEGVRDTLRTYCDNLPLSPPTSAINVTFDDSNSL
ncbi:hypothetical protein IWQ61_009170 [Dispira simplex]|nr:hypothetical protein IWQ61_009170 [Dispira simplex]